MADKKDGKSLRGKSRREALEFIKKSPEKFGKEFSAFYELETQLIEIYKYLERDCSVDKNDLLWRNIKFIGTKSFRAFQNSIYSLTDYCGELSFSNFILSSGASTIYQLIDSDYKQSEDGFDLLDSLIKFRRSSEAGDTFTRDVAILLGSHRALGDMALAIHYLLESQREKKQRDLAWEAALNAGSLLAQAEVLWSAKHSNAKEIIKNAISESKRKAAFARVIKDPKEAAMRAIEVEHEALKPHQKTKGYLAPFAREMQEKYPILQSTAAIERRIRKLKKSKQTK